MHLIQILLPLGDNDGTRFSRETFVHVRDELTDRFGGLTAYQRSPAVGLWRDENDQTNRDDIVIYEVLTPHLDRDWWDRFRRKLQVLFRQESILVRANLVELL